MALTDYNDFKTKLNTAHCRYIVKNGISVSSSRLGSLWTTAPESPSTPSTAVALDNTSTGAMLQQPIFGTITNPIYLAQIEERYNANNSVIQTAGLIYILCDRLSHQGGLDATVTTEQTTNLPTAALTRYTSGVGVMIALEIYATIGTTATTATVRYTNQAGTANQVTYAISFGSSAGGDNGVGRFFICPLADGDTGVKSVEGVTLAGTTGTAGNFGVTLFKPLAFINHLYSYQNAILGGGGSLVQMISTACPFLITTGQGSSGLNGEFKFIEVA